MDYIVIDTENSGACNGTVANPFSDRNKLCYIGWFDGAYGSVTVDVKQRPYGDALAMAQVSLVMDRRLVVAFNWKHDANWCRRYGIKFLDSQPVWDCQLAHFLMTGQTHPYPSLDEVLAYYGLEPKIDVVKTEYWDKGIDTDEVPSEVILPYLERDVMGTNEIFLKQIEELKGNPQLKKMIWWACQDLLTTAEIEWNGIKYDMGKSKKIGLSIEERIFRIDESLNSLFPDVSINWNSGDQLSAILYGGQFDVDCTETYLFTYKDGRVKEKSRKGKRTVEFPRLIEPIKGSGLKKEGYWSTADGIIQKLKPKGLAKPIIELITERTTLDTKLGKYYYGFPKKYEEMFWTDEIIHTNLNHCRTKSGRLSSTKPNIQNLEEQMRECVITRFQ